MGIDGDLVLVGGLVLQFLVVARVHSTARLARIGILVSLCVGDVL